MMGGLPPEYEQVPLNPERHVVAERPDHTVYAVTLGMLPGVRLFGYLCWCLKGLPSPGQPW